MIHFTCPHCDRDLRIPEQYIGATGRCNHCGNDITILISPEPPSHKDEPIIYSTMQGTQGENSQITETLSSHYGLVSSSSLEPYSGVSPLPLKITSENLKAWMKNELSRGVPREDLSEFLLDAGTDLTNRSWEEWELVTKAQMRIMDEMIERNMKALAFERSGEPNKAIRLYEANLADRFGGSGPYERLHVLYGRRKDYANALRVCKKYLGLTTNSHEDKKRRKFLEHCEKLQRKLGRTG